MPDKKSLHTPLKDSDQPNRRERRRKLQAQPAPAVGVIRERPKVLVPRIFTSLFFWAAIAIVVCGFLFVTYPRVSAHAGKAANPGQPFQIPFVVTNNGYWPLRDLQYSLSLEDIEFGRGNSLSHAYSRINEAHVATLDANKSVTISLGAFIDLLKQSFGIVLPPGAVTSAVISVDLSYRPYLVPYTFKNRIRFKTEKGNAGEYAWLEY